MTCRALAFFSLLLGSVCLMAFRARSESQDALRLWGAVPASSARKPKAALRAGPQQVSGSALGTPAGAATAFPTLRSQPFTAAFPGLTLAAPIRYVGTAAASDDFPSKLLKFALPKGSLQDATVQLFKRASYDIKFKERDYFPTINDPDIGMITFRAKDVSKYVAAGYVDAGISGRDLIIENGQAEAFEVSPDDKVVEVAELQYSKASSKPARWVVAVPEESPIKSVKDFQGKKIATELPLTTKKYFADRGIDVDVEFSWGTTEVKAKAMLVDGIVDITETGSSLKANNLRVVDTIMESTTRLIANKEAWAIPEKREKIKAIAMMLQAAINGKNKVGLKANVPKSHYEECISLLPAETAPTVADLTNTDYVSVEVICTGVDARDLTPKLYALGARGILTYPLHTIVS